MATGRSRRIDMKVQAQEVDPRSYRAHRLHVGERDWSETNCYVDVWIELLNALGLEPLAGLGFTIGIDLEGDQWTFYKFPHHELRQMYGLSVFEINPWVSMLDQTIGELRIGRPILIEVDSWFLPDTAGTAYRSSHVKTTIGVFMVDSTERVMRYVHNQSLYELSGEDFDGIFRLPPSDYLGHLPSYMESVKQSGPALSGDAQLALAHELLMSHVADAPTQNPFVRFAERLPGELEARCNRDPEAFHNYCFATFRQFGSAFSLASSHLDWLIEQHLQRPSVRPNFASTDIALAADAFRTISATAKSLQMKSARTALAGKTLSADEQLGRLIDSWECGLGYLRGLA
jgi:hypothetical protein